MTLTSRVSGPFLIRVDKLERISLPEQRVSPA